MHIHNVYFTMREGMTADETAAFEQGLDDLIDDAAATTGYWGKPADTHREVVQRDYDYGMGIVFEDMGAHDRYQVGDNHQRFVAVHGAKWIKVLVYDVETD